MTVFSRWTLHWWHWLMLVVAFLLLMVFTVLLALRATGRSDYQRVIADLRAKGKPATIDEFIAQAPVVDEALQEAWHQWSSGAPDYPDHMGRTFKPDEWLRFVMGEAPVSPALLQEIDECRVRMQVARDLLLDPRLLISAYGWLAQDLPQGKRRFPHTANIRLPNLLSTRALATWLHHAACTGTDPKPALDDLDRFHRALSRPASLIDAMIRVAIARIRNEAYLHLALLGRLPDANRSAWLAEACPLVAGVADGFDGERALFGDSWVQMGEDASLIGSFTFLRMSQIVTGAPSSTSWWDTLDPQWLYSGPWMWATIHHDGAVSAELMAHISARLRGERTDPVPDWAVIAARYRGYGAIAIPNLIESGITALESEARHRMHRIAVMVLADAARRGLPADVTDLAMRLGPAEWLTPGGDRLHLTYERLSPERFRLIVSPTSPIPNFDAPGRLSTRSGAFGTPPSKHPLVDDRTRLELRLPTALRPAP